MVTSKASSNSITNSTTSNESAFRSSTNELARVTSSLGTPNWLLTISMTLSSTDTQVSSGSNINGNGLENRITSCFVSRFQEQELPSEDIPRFHGLVNCNSLSTNMLRVIHRMALHFAIDPLDQTAEHLAGADFVELFHTRAEHLSDRILPQNRADDLSDEQISNFIGI